ncbi:hypothetical protein HSBAA_30810 [Vreelandella sulfidaeris]|uniref:Uncharacterized protein n=1 Tax=Vreelandella sulfidaeris TaxID=115553 RepID=A0A455U740_9GAMM|nr:hypothetical protein HSBAA_30810 [Halomonas sulfidaeris]
MRYVLFDSHAIGYAAQDGTKLTVGDREIQSIFGSIRSVRRHIVELKGSPPDAVGWQGQVALRPVP